MSSWPSRPRPRRLAQGSRRTSAQGTSRPLEPWASRESVELPDSSPAACCPHCALGHILGLACQEIHILLSRFTILAPLFNASRIGATATDSPQVATPSPLPPLLLTPSSLVGELTPLLPPAMAAFTWEGQLALASGTITAWAGWERPLRGCPTGPLSPATSSSHWPGGFPLGIDGPPVLERQRRRVLTEQASRGGLRAGPQETD